MMNNYDSIIQNLDAVTEHWLKETAGELDNYPRGITPREEIWRAGNISLLKFADSEKHEGTPLLIVPSLINRWYVLDVTEETSFISEFAQKRPTFVLDWGYPDSESGHLPLSHYYHKSIKRAIRQIRKLTGCKKVDMLGYCIGGTMAYAFSCLEPDLVDHLILLTAPLSFEKAGVLADYAKRFPVEEFSASMDKMPGWLLAFSFQFIQPLGAYQKSKMFHRKCESDSFLKLYNAMERWISDPVSFPARAYSEMLTDFYQDNLLADGKLITADGLTVDPSKRKAETLILNAAKDHIAPVPTTLLPETDKGTAKEVTIKSGHIGITTGRNCKEACNNVIDFIMN
ncbi:MAG: alpha/beta fold hydrolase [Candidatus Rifleibacteriota bacterium]